MTNSLYSVFERELNEEGVFNKYYLQGILRELCSDKYYFKRDYISKDAEVTDRLYNLQYESDQSFGDTFQVMGGVDFEQDAKQKIHLKIEKNRLPSGISKKLIAYLTDSTTTHCICGNPLCDAERQHISAYLDMMPPRSYTSLYQDFSKTAKMWGRGYDKSGIEKSIVTVLENNEQAEKCDVQIHELDEAEKKSPDIEDLIVTRQQAEQEIIELDDKISKIGTEVKKYEIYLKKQMQDFDNATKENTAAEKVNRKIKIMEEVAAYFRKKLDDESVSYSHRLEENIQSLIDDMLTSRRKVTVSPEFAVRVTDSFNDESKSEGQFAVVSFAYIGGILKMLRSEETG